MPHHPHPDPDCEALADAMGPSVPSPGARPPPGPVRGARVLAVLDGAFTRLDALIERGWPRAMNPLAQLGPAANALLLLATLSGVAMLVWYSPSLQFAWHSLSDLGPRSLGGIVRSMHRYSSDLAVLLILLHALRTLLARKLADARWLAWVSGLAMLGLVWLIGWTGYWLVWDVRAQQAALGTMKFLDVLPIFGEPMLRLYTSDRTVPSLLFFVVFFLHMVMPLAITGGLALHLARLSRSSLLPDRRLTAWLVGAVVAAAVAYPATTAAAAHMAAKPAAFTMDWWYLWPLQFTARLSGPGLWLAVGLVGLGFATMPWWFGRRRARPVYQATVNVSRCFACTLCSQDCPFGAITMVPRTDGKPFPSQAQIDPSRCIGCGVCAGACDTQGIGLEWFDAQQVTRELEAFVVAAVAAGRPPALAFVCAQSDGGWDLFGRAVWERRLPGYAVRPVPCAGWVEPKVIERILAKGARAVLVVGCSSSEAFCREGGQWLQGRLAGTREPVFRPNRADPNRMAHVQYDPLRPATLTHAAAALLSGNKASIAPAPRLAPAWLAPALLCALGLAGMLWATNAGFKVPGSQVPEFIFTFRANGDWTDQAVDAANDTRPIHMRAQQPLHRTRATVTVTVTIDGVARTEKYRPKGLASDGASVGELRWPLAPGRHHLTVRIATSPDAGAPGKEWDSELDALAGRNHVLSYAPEAGFIWEP